MLKLRRFLKNYKKELILGPFFKLLEAVFELIVPIVMAKIIDNGITRNDETYIWKMSGVIVILGICGLGFALTCQYFAARCAYGFGSELRRALYDHINKFSHTEIDKFGTSSLITRITNDSVLVQNGVNMFIRLAVRAPFLIIGATVMSMMIDLELSIILIGSALVITAVILLVKKVTLPRFKKIQKGLDRISLLTRESLDGARVIRAFSRQKQKTEELDEQTREVSKACISAGRISAILNPLTFMIINLGIVLVMWFGGVRVDSGHLTQGELTAFVNYMNQILLVLIVLSNLIVIFSKASGSAARVNEVFDTIPSINDGEGAVPDMSAPCIEFRNVSFTYPGASDSSLEDISFTLKKGEVLGIIGGTGSGKSTLANLIPRFYDATKGSIKIFGQDIKKYKQSDLRSLMGIVPQKAALFSGSIADNMRWGKPGASIDEINKALDTAQCTEFVEKLTFKTDTHINQGGKNLSGGQRQRLTIARALVSKPPIVILDDIMSALDYVTDLSLRQALKTDLSDTCVIIISQRIATLKNADTIIVLDDGRTVGMGRHDDLLDNCEEYKEIYDSQMN